MKLSHRIFCLSGRLGPMLGVLTLAGCLTAQDAAKSSPPASVKQTKPAPARLTIPKDAVETSTGFYRWTDKGGKVWIYRRSPFGVSRWPAASDSGYIKQNVTEKHAITEEQTVAVEEGDSIRFERSTPFGKRIWVHRKTELTAAEKAIWERQQKELAAGRAAEKE